MNPSDISRWQGSVDSWLAQNVHQGTLNDPAGGSVVVDTEQLAAGFYDFTVILASNAAHVYGIIEHRNAPNDTTLFNWFITWPGIQNDYIPLNNWKIGSTERMRIVTVNAANARLFATIQWVRRV